MTKNKPRCLFSCCFAPVFAMALSWVVSKLMPWASFPTSGFPSRRVVRFDHSDKQAGAGRVTHLENTQVSQTVGLETIQDCRLVPLKRRPTSHFGRLTLHSESPLRLPAELSSGVKVLSLSQSKPQSSHTSHMRTT